MERNGIQSIRACEAELGKLYYTPRGHLVKAHTFTESGRLRVIVVGEKKVVELDPDHVLYKNTEVRNDGKAKS